MGQMEQTLKHEITRLARKQLRATYLPLARDVRQLKRTVSALRKTVAVLSRLGAELQTERTVERAKLAAVPEEVKAARISPQFVRKLRKRLGITQGELATLVGVSTSAVGFWEYGKAKPEGRNRAAPAGFAHDFSFEEPRGGGCRKNPRSEERWRSPNRRSRRAFRTKPAFSGGSCRFPPTSPLSFY